MKLKMTKRHYFDNELSLRKLEDSVEDLGATAELGKKHSIDLSLLVSTNNQIPEEFNIRAKYALEKINTYGISTVYNQNGQTAGQKFIGSLFPQHLETERNTVLGLSCLDQFPLNREEHLEALIALAKKLLKENNVYATGSRNLPVRLGVNDEASNIRIIHEIVNSFVGDGNIFSIENKPQWASPLASYEHFGESTSGLYLLNPESKEYPRLHAHSWKNCKIAASPGFAIEYATALLAGENKSVSSGYVYALQNEYYTKADPQVERKGGLDFVAKQTSLVMKTDANEVLAPILANKNVSKTLKDYFDAGLVDETLEAMKSKL